MDFTPAGAVIANDDEKSAVADAPRLLSCIPDPTTGSWLSNTSSGSPSPATIVTGLRGGGGDDGGVGSVGKTGPVTIVKSITGSTSGGARILVGIGGNGSTRGSLKFPPLAWAL